MHYALTRENPAPPETIASRAIELVKVYGSGEEAIRALDHVTVGFPARQCISVDLPEPEGPMIAVNCLAGNPTVTWSRARIASSPEP